MDEIDSHGSQSGQMGVDLATTLADAIPRSTRLVYLLLLEVPGFLISRSVSGGLQRPASDVLLHSKSGDSAFHPTCFVYLEHVLPAVDALFGGNILSFSLRACTTAT